MMYQLKLARGIKSKHVCLVEDALRRWSSSGVGVASGIFKYEVEVVGLPRYQALERCCALDGFAVCSSSSTPLNSTIAFCSEWLMTNKEVVKEGMSTALGLFAGAYEWRVVVSAPALYPARGEHKVYNVRVDTEIFHKPSDLYPRGYFHGNIDGVFNHPGYKAALLGQQTGEVQL